MAIVTSEAVRRPANRFVVPETGGVVALLLEWDARFRSRRALERLGPERRADLGLRPEDIRIETAKPIWLA